jgi:GTPase SAR1 family protein
MLVGNKTDWHESRTVPVELAQQFAKDNSLMYIETSAAKNNNITTCFETLIRELYYNSSSPSANTSSHVTLDSSQAVNKSCCFK